MESRILIHAPIGKDAKLIAQLLVQADIECCICASLSDLMTQLPLGVGAVFVSDEAITVEFCRAIGTFIGNQPGWSDLPLVVMSRREGAIPEQQNRYLQLGNVSLVERPAQGVTLISAARFALRARRRQYAMREVDRRKDEFLAMLAHELRNPLAPIRAASELLRIPTLDRAKIEQTSHVISRQVKHMTGLIDDLLDLSRVSRGLITLENTLLDAKQILISAVEQVRPVVDTHRHRLTIQTPHEAAFVRGDQKRLIQVVANILNNAAKYTPEGGDITMALNIDATTVTYRVDDSGIGIAPQVIGHIFDMFTQAERTPDRAQGGLGIGLALVKDLVALHDGQVSAFSAGLGKGSRFTITLPRAANPVCDVEPEHHSNVYSPARRHRLLVVDDNRDAGDMLGLFLEAIGYEVEVVQDANTALEHARTQPPDVFLLDVGLPDMDGNELARRLRQLPQTASAVLIAVTGYGQDADRRKTSQAGFDYHLVKPVDMDELSTILSNLP
jgi:signal transduction histidine kinase